MTVRSTGEGWVRSQVFTVDRINVTVLLDVTPWRFMNEYSFIHLFYIPFIFTNVELVIYIGSLVGKQVYTVAPYCIITVSIADKISIHRFCLNVIS
jgi:hypothetical protein